MIEYITSKINPRCRQIGQHFFVALMTLFLVSSCQKDEAVPDESTLLSQTQGAWKVDQVTLDDKDVTVSYQSLILHFDEAGSFSCEHAMPQVWPASATFSSVFADNEWILTRNDKLEIKLSVLADTNQLKLIFFWPGRSPGGRFGGVTGQYEFTFSKI